MDIGFTGTRAGMTKEQKDCFQLLIAFLKPTRFHHGNCIGADTDAERIIRKERGEGCIIVRWPCNIPSVQSKIIKRDCDFVRDIMPPLVRNSEIVRASDVMIATPKEHKEVLRSGTWATIRCAKRTGHKLYIIWPYGTVSMFNFKENKDENKLS